MGDRPRMIYKGNELSSSLDYLGSAPYAQSSKRQMIKLEPEPTPEPQSVKRQMIKLEPEPTPELKPEPVSPELTPEPKRKPVIKSEPESSEPAIKLESRFAPTSFLIKEEELDFKTEECVV